MELEITSSRGKIMKVKNAMMIGVGCVGWDFPKLILVPTDIHYGRRLDEIAKEAFEKYKDTQQNKDIYLLNYSYQGDVEILTT